MDKEINGGEKRTYEAPRLTVFGEVQDITAEKLKQIGLSDASGGLSSFAGGGEGGGRGFGTGS